MVFGNYFSTTPPIEQSEPKDKKGYFPAIWDFGKSVSGGQEPFSGALAGGLADWFRRQPEREKNQPETFDQDAQYAGRSGPLATSFFGTPEEQSSRLMGGGSRGPNDIQRELSTVSDISTLLAAAEAFSDDLSPEAQDALGRLKNEAAQRIQNLDQQIQYQLESIRLTDAVLEKRLNPDKDVALDRVKTLAEVQDIRPGMAKDFLEDILNSEDADDIQALLHNQADKSEAINEIENFVYEKNQIKDQLATVEEDIRAADIAMQAPTIPLGLASSPEEVATHMFFTAFEPIEGLNPQQEEMLAGEMLGLLQGAEETLQYDNEQQAINAIATKYEIDPGQLQDAFKNGFDKYQATFEEVEGLADTNRIKPFSTGAAVMINDVALNMGMPEQIAERWANSPLVHRILERSNGSIGHAAGGDKAGVGDISQRVYDELGRPFDSVKDDIEAQLEVLFTYLLAGWSGDEQAAYGDMLATGEWGTLSLLRRNTGLNQALGGS